MGDTATRGPLREAGLRYGEMLLRLIRINGAAGRMPVAMEMCDRFERLMANLPPVTSPLVWEGDSA